MNKCVINKVVAILGITATTLFLIKSDYVAAAISILFSTSGWLSNFNQEKFDEWFPAITVLFYISIVVVLYPVVGLVIPLTIVALLIAKFNVQVVLVELTLLGGIWLLSSTLIKDTRIVFY